MLRGIANDDIYPLLFEEIDLEDEIICQAGLTTINKYIQSKNDEDQGSRKVKSGCQQGFFT